MENHQVAPIPPSQKSFLSQIARDFKAALSYVSFYSTDSPFVMQSIQKLYKDLQRLLLSITPVIFHLRGGVLFLNEAELPEMEDLAKLLEDKNQMGLKMTKGLTHGELAACLKSLCVPVADPNNDAETNSQPHLFLLSQDNLITILAEEKEPALPSANPGLEGLEALDALGSPRENSYAEKLNSIQPPISPSEKELKTTEALLGFVAEAWQFSQMQKKSMLASPEGTALTKSFENLFDRLLDRMEKSSPEFTNIYQWFKAPAGDLLENRVVTAMFPLLEVAVNNGWGNIFFDPTTEGLVNDCLTHWGANGRQDLVEKSVLILAEGLKGDALEKQLALTHLMDARPWVKNAELTQKVLQQLNSLLTDEISPGLYQTALLLAWDLTEPAMQSGKEEPVLALLSILHFHADEDGSGFPERSPIARHWLFERSNPNLIRHFVKCAFKAGQMNRYPLLGEMAAPILLEDYFKVPAPERAAALKLFSEMKESVRSTLAEKLADIQDESQIRLMFPILRTCGMDPGLSLLLSSWVAKGSRDLKLDLIGLIEEVGDPAGGPALRLALFDDDEEIASLAARIIGKIQFAPGLPVLIKACKIRSVRFPETDVFLISVCEALGDLGRPEGVEFLLEIARKKPLLRGKNFPLAIRLKAISALTKINQPEVWQFLETLTEEKNPSLQEALDRIIHERTLSS